MNCRISYSNRPTFTMSPRSRKRPGRAGAFTVIDGYQAVGTIPVDVRALGHRRLHRRLPEVALWRARATRSSGFEPEVRGRLEPALTGWMAHERPFAFEPELDRRDDAWRLLHGTPSIPALYAATARPGNDQRDRHRRRSAPSRDDKHRACLIWPTRRATAARRPRDPARRAGRSRSMSRTVTRSRRA